MGDKALSKPDRSCTFLNVSQDDCVSTNFGIGADHDWPQDLRPSPYINVASDLRQTIRGESADRDLLKNKAVYSYLGVRVDYDSVWVGNE
jgi:hypothetical protein